MVVKGSIAQQAHLPQRFPDVWEVGQEAGKAGWGGIVAVPHLCRARELRRCSSPCCHLAHLRIIESQLNLKQLGCVASGAGKVGEAV